MPDITMCCDITCPVRNECYRFRARTSGHRQSWIADQMPERPCYLYWDIDGRPEHDLEQVEGLDQHRTHLYNRMLKKRSTGHKE